MSNLKGFALVAGIATVVMAGCSPQAGHSEGSRADLYESVEQLADESELVVIATAAGDPSEFTAAQSLTGTWVQVDQQLTPKGLDSGDALAAGESLVVWQLGTESALGPLPLMKEGQRYLLFLTPTGLPELPADYFITGSSAGFWVATAGGFSRPVDEGDNLPETLTTADLEKAFLFQPLAGD